MRRIAAVIGLLAVVVVGAARAQFAAPGHVWIDAPLAAVVVTAAPVEVVAHANGPVVEMRLDVDGVTVASAPADGEGDGLVIARMTWTPTASGLHRLEVFPRGGSGEWGPPGTVRVRVELGATVTTTNAAATTGPAPTTTAPPTRVTTTTAPPTRVTTTTTSTTTTTCPLGTPTPSGTAGNDTLTPRLSWGYTGCQQPDQFQVQVSRDAAFARIEGQGSAGGADRSWTTDPLSDCATYFWRVRTFHQGSTGPWSATATFAVQTSRACG